MILLLLATGFVDVNTVLEDYYTISKHLQVEKRRKPRQLQMDYAMP